MKHKITYESEFYKSLDEKNQLFTELGKISFEMDDLVTGFDDDRLNELAKKYEEIRNQIKC